MMLCSRAVIHAFEINEAILLLLVRAESLNVLKPAWISTKHPWFH